MFYQAFDCLSDYLLATWRKNNWSDLHKEFARHEPLDKDVSVKLWKLSVW